MRFHSNLQLGCSLAVLFGLSDAAPADRCCAEANGLTVIELQPFEVICEGSTSTYTETRTKLSTCVPGPSGVPIVPPASTTTVYVPCDDPESCVPGTKLPPSDCQDCVVTITRPEPTPPSVPTTTTTTSTCSLDAASCAETTIPPSPGCDDCVVTIIVTPSGPSDVPPPVTTVTTTSTCTGPCDPGTVPPGQECTAGACTATIVTTPPPSVTTVTTTSTCTGPCEPETFLPGQDCTAGTCTVTIRTPLPSLTTEPPRTTVTTTSTCTGDACTPGTFAPGPDCTSETCVVTIITTPSPIPTTEPPRTTITTTSTCSDDDCTPGTLSPGSECSTEPTCVVTVITTPSPTPTTVTTTSTCTNQCEPTTFLPDPDCTDCTATEVVPRPCTFDPLTSTFDATGSQGLQTSLAVPECAESLTFEVLGGAGGNPDYGIRAGFRGGRVTGSIAVVAGESIDVLVGGRGERNTPGTGGYGDGGLSVGTCGSGGAGSGLSKGSTPFAVGAGAGGAARGWLWSGGPYTSPVVSEGEPSNGNSPGWEIEARRDGQRVATAYGGRPGTTSGPGAGGEFLGPSIYRSSNGNPGIGPDGGAGVVSGAYCTGGGGGGYFGGGSGGFVEAGDAPPYGAGLYGTGGGGANYLDSDVMDGQSGVAEDNAPGRVVIVFS